MSEESRIKMIERNKDCVWVNNGEKEKFIKSDKLQDFLCKNTNYFIGRISSICERLSEIAKTRTGDKNSMYGKKSFPVKDKLGNKYHITKEDPKYISGELVSVSKGLKFSKEVNKKKASYGKNNGMYGVKLIGENNGMYGKIHNEDTRNKISESLKNLPKIKCPHCNLESNNRANMKRYHFDNCKKI